jgi:serine/threonine-protein kinase
MSETDAAGTPSKKSSRKSRDSKVHVDPGGAMAASERTSVPLDRRFEVQELVGQGGMGRVYVAQDRGLGRVVALKQLQDGLETDDDALRRFVLEAQIGAQLTHPNILPLYSFERAENGAPAFAMQLVEGWTLADYAKEATDAPPEARRGQGPFALKERVGVLLGVCDAVHFAHERGVVHRDLKPENVMLGRYREVYVMDWGLARVLGQPEANVPASDSEAPPLAPEDLHSLAHAPTVHSSAGGAKPTQHGQILGTPQYMPPEQALGQLAKIGPATDQYALGVMLGELATLRPARAWNSLGEALRQAAVGELHVGDDVDGHAMDPALAAIVARATQRKPGDRYPSVEAFADDLRRFIRDEPVSVYQEGLAKKVTRAAGRRPALSVGIVAALLLGGAALLVGSLVRNVREAEQRAHDLEGTRRVLVAAGGRAHFIDVRLSDLESGVNAIGAAVVEDLAQEGSPAPAAPEAPLVLVPSPAYGGAAVSFARPVVWWAGKDDGAAAPRSVNELRDLDRWLRRPLVDGLAKEDRSAAPAARDAALADGRSALLRSFVGLEDGTFVQFPAREIARGYDARRRPWYALAKADRSLHWTRPVVAMDGTTVRIQALLGLEATDGQFLGVAGCDVRVSSLAKHLALDLPGFRRAYLVMEDGKVAVRDDLEALVLANVKSVDEPPELPAVDDATLAARIAAGDPGGYFTAGEKVFVYAKMVSPPWTYVAELDAAPYLGR